MTTTTHPTRPSRDRRRHLPHQHAGPPASCPAASRSTSSSSSTRSRCCSTPGCGACSRPCARRSRGSSTPATLRWVGFSHVEADECGALNDWLAVAPRAQPVCSQVAAMISLGDMADRPPRALADGEELALGRASGCAGSTRRTCPTTGSAGTCSRRRRGRCCAATCSRTRGADVPPLTESEVLSRREAMRQAMPASVAIDVHARAILSKLAAHRAAHARADARQLVPGRRCQAAACASATRSASEPTRARAWYVSAPMEAAGRRAGARDRGAGGRRARRRGRALPPIRAAHPALRPAPPARRGPRRAIWCRRCCWRCCRRRARAHRRSRARRSLHAGHQPKRRASGCARPTRARAGDAALAAMAAPDRAAGANRRGRRWCAAWRALDDRAPPGGDAVVQRRAARPTRSRRCWRSRSVNVRVLRHRVDRGAAPLPGRTEGGGRMTLREPDRVGDAGRLLGRRSGRRRDRRRGGAPVRLRGLHRRLGARRGGGAGAAFGDPDRWCCARQVERMRARGAQIRENDFGPGERREVEFSDRRRSADPPPGRAWT